jgi:hypothetical protein
MAGLLLLWLLIEHVCTTLTEKHVALFSNNSRTISWVHRMACRSSLMAKQLIRVLTLRMNAQQCCPLTTQLIAGDQNSMTSIPSQSFGAKQNGISKPSMLYSPFSTNISHTPTRHPGTCASPPLQ